MVIGLKLLNVWRNAALHCAFLKEHYFVLESYSFVKGSCTFHCTPLYLRFIFTHRQAAASLRWPIFDENPSRLQSKEEDNDLGEEQEQQGYRIATNSEYSSCGFQIWAKLRSMFNCSSSDSYRPCNRVNPTSLSQTSQTTEKG